MYPRFDSESLQLAGDIYLVWVGHGRQDEDDMLSFREVNLHVRSYPIGSNAKRA
jgi:hypothetical protein